MSDNDNNKTEKGIGTTEAATLLGCSHDSVRRAIDAKALPAWKTPGGVYRMKRQDVIEFRKTLEVK